MGRFGGGRVASFWRFDLGAQKPGEGPSFFLWKPLAEGELAAELLLEVVASVGRGPLKTR